MGHALWMEAAERSRQAQLEHDLAEKVAVRMAQEMEWVEKRCAHEREDRRWRGAEDQMVMDLMALCFKCQSIVLAY